MKRLYVGDREVLTPRQARTLLGVPRWLWRAARPRSAVIWTVRGRMYDAGLVRDLRDQKEASS